MNSGRMNENLDFLRTKWQRKKNICKIGSSEQKQMRNFCTFIFKSKLKIEFLIWKKQVVLSILCRHPSIDEDDDEKYGWSRKKWKEKKRDVDHVKKYKNKIDTCHFVWESHIYACL